MDDGGGEARGQVVEMEVEVEEEQPSHSGVCSVLPTQV